MPTYIALLRSVNVLGKNMIRMPELAGAFEKAGFDNVRTYIQSGNVIFGAEECSTGELSERIRELITKHFGLTLQVLVLTPAVLEQIMSDNPFIGRPGIDITRLHVTFLSRVPESIRAEKLLSYSYPPDEIMMHSRAAYLHCPEGYGRTRYDNTFIEKKLDVTATTRNWNTCLKLLEICRA